MSFKDFLIETGAGAVGGGATTAGSVAGFRGSLFGSTKKRKKKKTPTIRRTMGGPVGNTYSFKFFSEATEQDFDPADVIAKLKTASKSASKRAEDTVAFALEDENGAMVKIWVVDDQADDFQEALEAALARSDEDDDDENDRLEIAEVLWKLRNDFDIVDVEWGNIPEDQEEMTTAPAGGEEGAAGGGAAGAEGVEGAEGAAGAEGVEGEMSAEEPIEGEGGAGGEETAASALQQVIDMMKADAEAKKAEAEAEIAKAQSEQAKYAAQAAEQKVKQEEEVLDMEAYYDAEKNQKQEADKLSKLAKYRHELAKGKGVGLGGTAAPEVEVETPNAEVEIEPQPENEETVKTPRKIRYARREDLGDMILKALRGDE